MSLIYYSIILILISAIVPLALFLYKNKQNTFKIILKVFSLLLAGVFSVRYLWGQDAIQTIYMLGSDSISGGFANAFALLLVWLTYSSVLLCVLYPFFNVPAIKKYCNFFALPIGVLNIIFLGLNFSAIIGTNAINLFSLRGIFFAIEIGLTIAYLLVIFISQTSWSNIKKYLTQKREKTIKTKKSFWQVCKIVLISIGKFFKNNWIALFCVAIIILSTMPAYTMQGFFGHIKQTYTCKGFEIPHRVILYIGIILPFLIHFALKKLSYDEKRFYLLFICLGTLLSFSLNHKFVSFLDPVKWPLHLCNTAMYIMPVVLIFKMKRFFYFTYFINVVGAFFAMFMPNYDATLNMFSTNLLVFYINHYIAFFMPILFVSLGMFQKPKFRQFVYSMLGFLGYFILVLFLNALYTGMHELGLVSASTDFFFVNSDFIADKLGEWAERLRDVTASFNIGNIKLIFYPVYQVLFFVAYIGIGLAMWFIYEQGYEISASMEDIRVRKRKIKLERLALESKLNGREITEPMNKENVNKLILDGFTKRYGNSNVYAVDNASLEVVGGEIFGFLGPNGAGKSTIIKSIVGIQPITDGRIEVCGYDVDKQSVEAKRQIGFVPDHYALYEKLTGREYINYIADLYDVSLSDRTERIDMYVKRFELETAFDNQMKTYSHGMKQKIAIMAALVHNPKVWILDEPLTGLDPSSIFQVKECMKEHTKNGNIVFFSSHIIDVVERICDKIAIIKKGHILITKSVKEIEDSGVTLEQFYMDTISDDGEKK